MTIVYIVLAFIYVVIGSMVFGIGVTIEPKMPWVFVLVMACIWPVSVGVGIGVMAANSKGYH